MINIKRNTKWVLFLSSEHDNAEDRHIFDLAYFLYSIECAGIQNQDIFIYVDGQDRAKISGVISQASSYQHNILPTSEFFDNKDENTHENMIFFVSGHGGPLGISSQPDPVTPFRLLECIKTTPNLTHAVVYLGQCFAGVFNYISAGRGRHQVLGNPDSVDIVFIGATNLNESISSSTTETFLNGDFTWVANVFLLHISKWFRMPFDIDGDGSTTIMDSYKFAGSMSNHENKNNKVKSCIAGITMQQALFKAHEEYNQDTTNVLNEAKLDSAYAKYSNYLSVNYVHQESWILNSISAQKFDYS